MENFILRWGSDSKKWYLIEDGYFHDQVLQGYDTKRDALNAVEKLAYRDGEKKMVGVENKNGVQKKMEKFKPDYTQFEGTISKDVSIPYARKQGQKLIEKGVLRDLGVSNGVMKGTLAYDVTKSKGRKELQKLVESGVLKDLGVK